MIRDRDIPYLKRCLELAKEALNAGDRPFGSVLVGEDGTILMEERNRILSVDPTRHPELEIARWAGANLTPEQRANATVYTSGEHCVMCSAAHGWAGLGRVVYISSTEQLVSWLEQFGAPAPPVTPLPIQAIAPHVEVVGPVEELVDDVYQLHRRFYDAV